MWLQYSLGIKQNLKFCDEIKDNQNVQIIFNNYK